MIKGFTEIAIVVYRPRTGNNANALASEAVMKMATEWATENNAWKRSAGTGLTDTRAMESYGMILKDTPELRENIMKLFDQIKDLSWNDGAPGIMFKATSESFHLRMAGGALMASELRDFDSTIDYAIPRV